jgi:broad specificity phosphatase PhoE
VPRLFLARHGVAEAGGTGRYWGWTDVPLSDDGAAQARALGARLARESVVAVYASDLARALETAQVVAEHHGLDVTVCPELREMNFGRFEGLTFDEIRRSCADAERLLSADDPHAKLPGGESLADLTRRVEGFEAKLLSHAPSDGVIIVSHGGPLRVLVCRALGLGLAGFWRIRMDHGSLSVVDTCSSVLEFLNDTCHLKLG